MNDSTQVYGLLDVAVSLARQWMILILIPLLVAVCVASALMKTEPKYTALARVLPPQQNKETADTLVNRIGGTSALSNSSLTLKNPVDLYVGIMSSRSILERVIRYSELHKHYEESNAFTVMKKLSKNSKIRAGSDGILSISVTDASPEKAAEIANNYIKGFYDLAREISERDAGRRDEYFQSLVAKARERLDSADTALRKTEESTGIVRLSGQEQAIVGSIAELSALISVGEAKLQSMLAYGTERNPDVRRVRRELRGLKRQLSLLEGKRQKIVGGKSVKDVGDASLLVPVGAVPSALEETIKRRREVKYGEILYELVRRSYELSKIDVTRDITLLQVLDYALPPTDKTSPKLGLTTVAAAFATFVWTVVAVVVIDSIRKDTRRRSGFRRLLLAFIRRDQHA